MYEDALDYSQRDSREIIKRRFSCRKDLERHNGREKRSLFELTNYSRSSNGYLLRDTDRPHEQINTRVVTSKGH